MEKDKFHDRGYKLLFSHPQMIEDLLKSFVKEDFVAQIDYQTLKPVKTVFVSSTFEGRENDVIWEINIGGKKAYLYILIDFQSTVDKFMSLRLLTYIGLFYEHLLKKEKEQIKIDKLPSVFPILLYNGERKWTAPVDISDLIDISFPSLRPYILHFRYYKIAENEFSDDSLKKINNLVARLFLIEQGNMEDLVDIISDTVKILAKEISEELKRDFGLWLRATMKKKGIDIDLTKLNELEVKSMLSNTLEKFKEDTYKEGIEKGIEKGIKKGELKKAVSIAGELKKLNLSTEEISRITGLSPEEIKKIQEQGCSNQVVPKVPKLNYSYKCCFLKANAK